MEEKPAKVAKMAKAEMVKKHAVVIGARSRGISKRFVALSSLASRRQCPA